MLLNFHRDAAMAAIAAYISFLPQQKGPGRGWWTVLMISGLGPLTALVMLGMGRESGSSCLYMVDQCVWWRSACDGPVCGAPACMAYCA